ncbi:hypothetical protein OG883_30325 [Streptomyces sp. NBC_01142]|uniref:hypothetical protein n=1 Tax=Streptomyces sp. NBC_01142 TaxID=2975865 RepID=UPI0022525518|nr:hypothetical protein [Streptomyces sp. NBC_01142]MCX4824093.1 hypothetical protein [Streptomyces sp. NBC_01142]
MVVQQHRRRDGAFAVAAALLGVVAASGCSGGGAVAEDWRVVGSVDQVRNAADALAVAGSSKARTSMEMATGGTRVTIRGEGAYDFERRMGRLVVVLPKDPAGADEHRPVTELLTSGALYMKNRGAGVPADKWVRVDTTTLEDGNLVTGGATDPLAAAELLRGARDVTYLGDEELAGTKVRHYRGTADIAYAARIAEPHARASLAAAAKGFAEDTVPFDAYLDEAGRLRKVRHEFSFASQGRTAAVTSTTLLYDFGTPVAVRLPEERDIYAGKIRA